MRPPRPQEFVEKAKSTREESWAEAEECGEIGNLLMSFHRKSKFRNNFVDSRCFQITQVTRSS